MNTFIIQLVVGSAVVLTAFGLAWRAGWIARLAAYVGETREELRKCNWPTREELWQSTVVVLVVFAMLGLFTVGSDFIVSYIVKFLLKT